jgi:hypothetical protein
MKIPVIKTIVEQYQLEELKKGEEQLMNGEALTIEVGGDDEGEQLTHILAAIWIKEHMQQYSSDYKTALRAYTEKVRSSIN